MNDVPASPLGSAGDAAVFSGSPGSTGFTESGRAADDAGRGAAAARGDSAGLVAAFERHHRDLYAFARRATGDPDAADDAVAEAFARLVREERRGAWPENVGGWLHRVTANVIVSAARRRTVLARVRGILGRRTEPMAAGPDDGVLRRERATAIDGALANLPRDARVALLLAAHGFSGAEIAAAIGKSETATRSLMCRARLRLRESLAGREVER